MQRCLPRGTWTTSSTTGVQREPNTSAINILKRCARWETRSPALAAPWSTASMVVAQFGSTLPRQGANLWRTTGDINDTYARMLAIGFGQAGLEKFAGPGHWNDPDMLEVGNGGMKDNEYRMHMSLWCLLAAPLMAGNDLATMTPQTLAILTNPEVIDVDQDPAGIQGRSIMEEGPIVVMMKPMADGSKAVGFFNREQGVVTVSVKFADIGLSEATSVRDLWQKKDLGEFRGSFSANVPEHGVVFVRIHSK